MLVMWYTKSILKEIDMTKNIYTVEDFEERLSELTIGTEDVQELMLFVRRLEANMKCQGKRLETAANMLGHYVINDTLMDEDDV